MKVLILESGTLINLSMNGLLYILEGLKKNFSGKFIITQQVKYETIDHPLKIERFALGALEVQNLLNNSIIELPDVININQKSIDQETKKFLDLANHYLQAQNSWIPIVSDAEMSCLALSAALMAKGIDNLIAIDERTTRMLGENPQQLGLLMSEKLHQPIELAENNFPPFAPFHFIRSAELVYVAYKKGLVHLKGPKVIDALLYATKFKGCAISFDEINELKRL